MGHQGSTSSPYIHIFIDCYCVIVVHLSITFTFCFHTHIVCVCLFANAPRRNMEQTECYGNKVKMEKFFSGCAVCIIIIYFASIRMICSEFFSKSPLPPTPATTYLPPHLPCCLMSSQFHNFIENISKVTEHRQHHTACTTPPKMNLCRTGKICQTGIGK